MAQGPRSIRIGISSCLLGQEVRYDGGHKRDRFLTDVLGSFVEWVPVCPEVESGMGIPRPSVRLVRSGDDVRMIAERTGEDHTRSMRAFSRKRVAALRKLDLAGYVLKRDSPSCGMERVRVYAEGGMPEKKGRGLFAEALIDGMPQLPVEEEGRLNDAVLRENFIERVFAYRRLRDLFRGRWSVGSLVAFHTAHKLQLMSHEPKAYQQLGRLVGEAKGMDRDELRSRYIEAWDDPESPGALPMPLQHLATAEAHQRVRRAALAGSPTAAELTVTPVGQIVGRMNQLRPARQVVAEMVDEYLDTVERMARLMEDTEKGA